MMNQRQLLLWDSSTYPVSMQTDSSAEYMHPSKHSQTYHHV